MGARLSTRAQSLTALSRPEGFDLAVVGGGATGLAVALQAAWAGRSVALIEAQDFASGTSSRSTKLLHGGVRYLTQGEISLVRDALNERKALIDLAPDLAHPLRFVIPAYRWWERLFCGAGLVAYDWLAGSASLGKTEHLSRDATLSRYSTVSSSSLSGAVSYCDSQFYDAGLAIAMARGAAAAGAALLYRVQATAVTAGAGGLTLELTDRLAMLDGVVAQERQGLVFRRELVTAQAGRKLAAGRKPPRPKAADVDSGAPRSGHPARYLWAQLLARIYGVFALKCSWCGGRVRLIGFITEPATVRQILAHVGEPTSAPAIAPARSPPVEANAQQLIAPEAVEAIPELEFD